MQLTRCQKEPQHDHLAPLCDAPLVIPLGTQYTHTPIAWRDSNMNEVFVFSVALPSRAKLHHSRSKTTDAPTLWSEYTHPHLNLKEKAARINFAATADLLTTILCFFGIKCTIISVWKEGVACKGVGGLIGVCALGRLCKVAHSGGVLRDGGRPESAAYNSTVA